MQFAVHHYLIVLDRELNIQERDTIVAELCADAPNNDVRGTLRLYDARLDTRALVKQLSRTSKNSLVESLSYLAHDGMNDYTKEACITALICRVQNLFPDQCSFCREQYCIRLADKLDLTTFFLYLSKITSNLLENYLRSKTTSEKSYSSKK